MKLRIYNWECQDYVYVKWKLLKYYTENKVLSYCEALRCETTKNNKNLSSFKSNLQMYYHFKLDFQKWTNIQEAISCKAWNSPVEYPSRECKYDMKETEGNMFIPILKKNV